MSKSIPRLKHHNIIRLGRLLDMMYRPSEIAEEIDVTVDTIYRSWLPAGLPHKRDSDGSIWIHGPVLVAWAKETIAQSKKKSAPLEEGHGWCMKCNQAVVMVSPTPIYSNRYIEIVQSVCPKCGIPVNRAQKRSLS